MTQVHIIDGKKIATNLRSELQQQVKKFATQPGLAIILIGDDPGSHTYVGLKEKAAQEAGIYFEKHIFPDTVPEEIITTLINKLNDNEKINGIVVQFPLPPALSKDHIIKAIKPSKDVDGFHPANMKALRQGRPSITPALSEGIVRLIKSTKVPLSGKRVLVLANSTIFSEPLDCLLAKEGVQTQGCNPEVGQCQLSSQQADILVVAIGQPRKITASYIKPGAMVIDVGYNRVAEKPVGDVDFESVSQKAGWLTPVPGGVGPMTVAMLLKNVVYAYQQQHQG